MTHKQIRLIYWSVFFATIALKASVTIYQLNEHREVKHEGKRIQCDICDNSWAKEKNLIINIINLIIQTLGR